MQESQATSQESQATLQESQATSQESQATAQESHTTATLSTVSSVASAGLLVQAAKETAAATAKNNTNFFIFSLIKDKTITCSFKNATKV